MSGATVVFVVVVVGTGVVGFFVVTGTVVVVGGTGRLVVTTTGAGVTTTWGGVRVIFFGIVACFLGGGIGLFGKEDGACFPGVGFPDAEVGTLWLFCKEGADWLGGRVDLATAIILFTIPLSKNVVSVASMSLIWLNMSCCILKLLAAIACLF